MATHSSVLAWRIPGTGEPGGLPSMGLHRVGHVGSNLAAAGKDEDFLVERFMDGNGNNHKGLLNLWGLAWKGKFQVLSESSRLLDLLVWHPISSSTDKTSQFLSKYPYLISSYIS